MTGAGRCALLLLLYLLQSAPGRSCLAPPQNVTLLSRNFSVYLTWLPGPGHLQNVTYVVAYQSSAPPRRWQKVKKCAGTKALSCSLMCLEKQDLYNKFKGRVRAVSPSARSPWVESEYLEYLFQVEPAPPNLVFTLTEEILSVNATYQLPPCMPPADLKYEVDFWKEGIMNKTRYPVTPRGQLVQIPLQPATKGQHCLRARTIYTFGDTKYSEFSKPTCFPLAAPSVNWAFLVLLPLLPLLLVIVMGRMLWKNFTGDPWFQQAKKPQALDFSGHRHPPATFQPSGPEPLNDLTLYPQKELARKVKLTPRARVPATTQAVSEKDSAEEDKDDDEENMDDSLSVQPYIEHPCFLKQEHQMLGHSEAGVQLEGSSAWDSSYRSWTSSAGSSSWDEAGSSGYLANKEPGQELDVDGCQEALSLLKFSENSGSLHEPLKDDLSSWATWGSSLPKLSLVPRDPPVSLHTLTFCWDSSPEEEEEYEEEEEGEDERESEIEDGGSSSWVADSLQRTEAKGRTLGCYMAR